jgi:hypothetical protein
MFVALRQFSLTPLLNGQFDEAFMFSSRFFFRLEDSFELRVFV